jgi:RNA polymerase-binding transcription factor DksA
MKCNQWGSENWPFEILTGIPTLRQIQHALSRIANGTYGVCLHCEEDILPKRMAAVPWAAFCITSQEMVDQREILTAIEWLTPAA